MAKKSCVYLLENSNGRYYIGSTNNLRRRLEEHLSGRVKSTRYNRPWKLVFYQEYENLIKARQIEYKLKKFKRKDILTKIVAEQKISMGS